MTRRAQFNGIALSARLRSRDLTVAPAVLSLLESQLLPDLEQAAALMREISPRSLGGEAPGHLIGITGPPGVGKSTLIAALVRTWRQQEQTVAVLAVDPSSQRSGGALLGDRIRIQAESPDSGVFIRSIATGERAGGLTSGTRWAAQALAVTFDRVVIETIGVGQAETEVANAIDTTVVVVQPGSGDTLQFLKSGLMEVPDILVVSKADYEEVAHATGSDLVAALSLQDIGPIPILPVSAVTSSPDAAAPPQGVAALMMALEGHHAGIDIKARRTQGRRAGALSDYIYECGNRNLRLLGGRHAAERILAEQDADLGTLGLLAALERSVPS